MKLLSGLLLVSSPVLAAAQLEPLPLRNQSPLTRLYGIPVAQPATLLAPAASLWQLDSTLANTFSRDSNTDEAVFLDGESAAITLRWRRGVVLDAQRLEVSASLDAVHHGGGVLDHGIVEFHDTMGLPQGNRTRFEADQLRYAYRDGSDLLQEFEQSGAAIGDLQLGAAYALSQQPRHDVALRAELKLPTGDADRLSGSGAADLALSLHFGTALWRGQFDMAGGVVALGEGDVLAQKQRDAVGFGHIAYAWPWSADVALLAQLGGNSGVYAGTTMTGLKAAAFFGVGARWRLQRQWHVEVGLTEDILVNSTPDVVFTLGLRYSPRP